MTTFTSDIDFRGARGSNTGDQFHELWALLQVLDLLHPETDLKAVGVEGVLTETPAQNVRCSYMGWRRLCPVLWWIVPGRPLNWVPLFQVTENS